LNNSIKKALVLAAHPDDETLGMGGTIAKLSASGVEVKVVILTEGVSSRIQASPSDLESRKLSCSAAMKILGVKECFVGSFRDNALDSYPVLELVNWVESFLIDFKPDTVFATSPFDLNIDHRYVGEIAQIISRPLPNSSINQLYFYEVRSSSEWRFIGDSFRPNVYFDIERTNRIKTLALNSYQQELRDFPHPRSLNALEALSVLRGSEAGYVNAEAFMLGMSRN